MEASFGALIRADVSMDSLVAQHLDAVDEANDAERLSRGTGKTLKWVDWYNNTRLHSGIGYITPHEAEEALYARLKASEKAA